MEQLFFAGKAYLKINSLVKTPLHEFMAVECSGLWAPVETYFRFHERTFDRGRTKELQSEGCSFHGLKP